MSASFMRKPFYRLQELCSRWGLSIGDLSAFALAGELRISVPVVGLRVEEGECDDLTLDLFNQPKGTWKAAGKRIVTGTVDLLAQDAWVAMQDGRVQVRYFQNGPGSYLRVDPWAGKGHEIAVEREDLAVLQKETERFESARRLWGCVATLSFGGRRGPWSSSEVRLGRILEGGRAHDPHTGRTGDACGLG